MNNIETKHILPIERGGRIDASKSGTWLYRVGYNQFQNSWLPNYDSIRESRSSVGFDSGLAALHSEGCQIEGQKTVSAAISLRKQIADALITSLLVTCVGDVSSSTPIQEGLVASSNLYQHQERDEATESDPTLDEFYKWDEDDFVVYEAIQTYVAQLDADN